MVYLMSRVVLKTMSQPLTIFAKSTILYVWQGCEFPFANRLLSEKSRQS